MSEFNNTSPSLASAPEATWRRRFRAVRVSRPDWARDDPDRLLYSSNASGKYELYAWNRRADSHRQVTDRPAGTSHGTLDPTGEWVWWFDDEGGSEFGRWVVEPFLRSTEKMDVAKTRPAAPDVAPGYSAGLALARGFAVIGTVTDAGVTVHLALPGSQSRLLYSHREDAEVADLSRDETLICLSHSEHGDSRHPALRVIDVEGNTRADLWDGPGKGLWSAEWSPIAGDERLLVTHERGDLPRPLIWEPLTGAVTEIAIDLPGEVEAIWYPDARALLIAHDYRGRSELYRLELASNLLTKLEVEPGTASSARVRPDGEVWYIWTRADTPPEVRADDRRLLAAPGEPAPGGVRYSEHTIGDVPIFLAEPLSPRPHPTIFYIHGGPTWHDSDAFTPVVQAFVDHGFAVVLVNYRGSTGFGRAWRDALEGNPGLTELEDIAGVHDWAIAEGIAELGRVVLGGNSWGGYVTLLGLGVQPERWALGLAGVPVADYVAAFEDEMEPLKAFDRSIMRGSPTEIPEEYAKRSPIEYVADVRAPLLILAGQNDPRCPIRQIKNYVARLVALGKPHEVYRFDAGHGSLVVEETVRQVEARLSFAARYLGTPAPM